MTDLPEPLVPHEVDLRDFPFTPIFRARLFGSAFHARSSDAEWRAGVTLWLKSWDQVPAGTLPTDDIDLCRLAELGRDLRAWAKVKKGALHGWVECSDGRLHHRVVAEGILEAWQKRRTGTKRGVAGAAGKWGQQPGENKKKRHERLAEARAKGTHTEAEWLALVAFCGFRCVRCGEHVDRPVKDHIRPIYQGGSDAITNIQPMCVSCNCSKGPDSTDHRPAGWERIVALTPAQTGITAGVEAGAKTDINGAETSAVAGTTRLLTSGKGEGEGQGQGDSRTKPNGLGAPRAVDPAKRVFDTGKELLARYAIKPHTAGGLLTQWRREMDDDIELMAVLLEAGAAERSDIVAFIAGCIRARKGRPDVGAETDDLYRRMNVQ